MHVVLGCGCPPTDTCRMEALATVDWVSPASWLHLETCFISAARVSDPWSPRPALSRTNVRCLQMTWSRHGLLPPELSPCPVLPDQVLSDPAANQQAPHSEGKYVTSFADFFMALSKVLRWSGRCNKDSNLAFDGMFDSRGSSKPCCGLRVGC